MDHDGRSGELSLGYHYVTDLVLVHYHPHFLLQVRQTVDGKQSAGVGDEEVVGHNLEEGDVETRFVGVRGHLDEYVLLEGCQVDGNKGRGSVVQVPHKCDSNLLALVRQISQGIRF